VKIHVVVLCVLTPCSPVGGPDSQIEYRHIAKDHAALVP